jgi:multidrug efflux pump subunit AcrA (membrane-fusion protein)
MEGEAGEEGSLRVTAAVEVRTLQRKVVTRGVLGYGSGDALVAAGGGRVTAVDVSTGSIVKPGEHVLEIEGRPMVAVRATKPLWRDLAAGARGADVVLLQEVLHTAGYLSFDPDGSYGTATVAALRAWQKDHGFPDADGIFRVDDWLVADWPRRVGRVHASVGDFLEQGSELFTVSDNEPFVAIELTPSDRIRVARGDPVRIEVAATGDTVRGRVHQLGLSPQTEEDGSVFYPGKVAPRDALDVPEGAQVGVTIVIERARDVLAVPLASVVADGDGGAAVVVVDPGGSRHTASVELGLSEGAWVEVTSGLSGSESVVVAEQ